MNLFLRLICIFIPGSRNRHRFKQKIKNMCTDIKLFLPSLSPCRQKFDLIVSLGDVCQTSFNLRVNNLQFRSYPFDWLCKASQHQLIDLVNNNFKNFLDRCDLVPTERNSANLIVDNKRTGNQFQHDFEFDSIDEDYDKIADKYERRFARFNKSIDNARRVLFVYRKDNATPDDIRQLHAALARRFKSQEKINILWIVAAPKQTEVIKTKICKGVIRATLDCDAYEGPDKKIHRWRGNAKQYETLLKSYALTVRGYFINTRKNNNAK